MPTPLPFRIALWAWLILALVATRFGALKPLAGVTLAILPILIAAVPTRFYFQAGRFRTWLDQLDLRSLLLLHATRFFGYFLLLLAERGRLPAALAATGGWGNLAVATLAVLLVVLPLGEGLRHRLVTIWNVVGAAGCLLFLLEIGRIGLATPGYLRPMTELPLGLLPLFLLPLFLFTHLVIFHRLNRPTSTP